jgi:hypothetical protein
MKRLIAIAALVLATLPLLAQVPRTIAFQGKLVNGAGTALDGPVSVTFTLYDASAGGATLWSETKTVTAVKGLFATALGDSTPIAATVLFDKPYFLGVKVGADAEMTPRVALQSVPYALGVPGMTVTNGGDVNIATSSATMKLAVGGDVSCKSLEVGGGGNTIGFYHDTDTFTYQGKKMGNYALGWFSDTWFPPAPTAWMSGYAGIKFFTNGTPRLTIDVSGNVAVLGPLSCTTLTLTSSRRFKQDITPINGALDTLGKLQGVSYRWDEAHGGKADLGFIAEDVGKVVPELVTYEADGKNAVGMDYSHLTALTVEGIKEQQAQIEQLKADNADKDAQLAKQQQELDALSVRLARLEALVGKEGK